MGNPAQRLHTILSRAAEVSENIPMIEGWRRALTVATQSDDFLVMSQVGRVFTLPEIIAKEIARFPDIDAELYLGWRKELEEAFRHINFQASFNDFRRRLSKSLLINIQFCAHELNKRLPEKEISPEELEKLREAVSTLYDEVLKSDLPPDLFRYALDHLFLIIEALDNYSVTGATGIEMALNAVIGTVVTQHNLSKKFAESAVGTKFWQTMGRIAVALSLGKFGYELADTALKALGYSP
jgi:hypothetical protein